MLESSLHVPIIHPLPSNSTYPSIHFSTCTLHWGQAPFIPLFHTYLPSFHLAFIILFHLWSSLSLSFHPSTCTFHIPCTLSIHFPTYIHIPSIYLILTCHPYLAVHHPCHDHPFMLIFHPYSYTLPFILHMFLILVIPSISSTSYHTFPSYPSYHYPFSSISFISLSLFLHILHTIIPFSSISFHFIIPFSCPYSFPFHIPC